MLTTHSESNKTINSTECFLDEMLHFKLYVHQNFFQRTLTNQSRDLDFSANHTRACLHDLVSCAETGCYIVFSLFCHRLSTCTKLITF